MSNAHLLMTKDRALRDAAKALVEADIAHLRSELAERGIAARAADRIAEGASDVYDEAAQLASENKGPLAAIIAALVLWFARHPILEALFGDDDQRFDDEDQAAGDRHPGSSPYPDEAARDTRRRR